VNLFEGAKSFDDVKQSLVARYEAFHRVDLKSEVDATSRGRPSRILKFAFTAKDSGYGWFRTFQILLGSAGAVVVSMDVDDAQTRSKFTGLADGIAFID
jgi:hypothetical protein